MNPGDDGTEVLDLIADHYDSIREHLTDEQYGTLLTHLRALADSAPDDARAVRRALQRVRLSLVPLPYGHPVREALDSERLVAAPTAPRPVVLRTVDLLARITMTPPAPGTPAIIAGVEQRLLRAPALTATEVRGRYGGTEPPPHLIRLADPERGDRYPEFQFTAEDGTPYQIVLEINGLLCADADPWGAADWWLSANAWLGGKPPAALLGGRGDDELLDAAQVLVEGD
ncbi:hypothetical protein ABII15_03390 [Streptomyces sp. HUAS MG91]|uniref:DUF3168 domain-containing protein n=1 Tax=Streptomyces tabacisoli TaxID=3156398 RepID=A0AAU8IMJ2_9ACTN